MLQVTALTAGDIHLVVGGAHGDVQVLVLGPQDPSQSKAATTSSNVSTLDANTLATTSQPEHATQVRGRSNMLRRRHKFARVAQDWKITV